MSNITVDKKMDVIVRIIGKSREEIDKNTRITHDLLCYALPNCVVNLCDRTPLEERVEHLEDMVSELLQSKENVIVYKREGTD